MFLRIFLCHIICEHRILPAWCTDKKLDETRGDLEKKNLGWRKWFSDVMCVHSISVGHRDYFLGRYSNSLGTCVFVFICRRFFYVPTCRTMPIRNFRFSYTYLEFRGTVINHVEDENERDRERVVLQFSETAIVIWKRCVSIVVCGDYGLFVYIWRRYDQLKYIWAFETRALYLYTEFAGQVWRFLTSSQSYPRSGSSFSEILQVKIGASETIICVSTCSVKILQQLRMML